MIEILGRFSCRAPTDRPHSASHPRFVSTIIYRQNFRLSHPRSIAANLEGRNQEPIMKKLIQIGDDVSMDDAKWEQTRRLIVTSASLTEASDLLEEETSLIYRRRRRHGDNDRPKREKPSVEDDTENFTCD